MHADIASPRSARSPAGTEAPARLARDLTLVERDLSPGLKAAARAWLGERLPDVRVRLAVADLASALAAPADRPELAPLALDALQLARVYARRLDAPALELRLERIEDDGCRAFHRDHVHLRLMTTYLGPGTQYVSGAAADAALRLQSAFDGPVLAMATGAVGWVAGTEAGGGRGLVHRSPPLAGSGLLRLFLAINTPLESSPAAWTAMDGPVFA